MSFILVAVPGPNSPAAIRLAVLLVVTWLAAMAALLWQFEKQRIADSRQLFHFDARDLPPAPMGSAAGAAKALYFLDRGCHCTAAALAEIARVRVTAAPPVEFVFENSAGIDATPLSAAERSRWQSHIPATPAVALWDSHDKLIYFGPINVNAGCGDSRSYLEMALRTLRQQPAAAFTSWDVVACRCKAPVNVKPTHL